MNDFSHFVEQILEPSRRSVFFTDCNLHLHYASELALKRFSASSLEEIVGKSVDQLDIAEELKRLIQSSTEAVSAESPQFEDSTRLNASDATTLVSLSCSMVRSDQQEHIGYCFQLGSAVHQATFDEIIINNLMKTSKDMIYFKDLNSVFTRCSDALVERLGATDMSEVIGKSDFDFWDPECAGKFFNDEQEIIRTENPVIGKAERELRSDGKSTWVLSSKMPLFDENGDVVGTFGISRDITALKQTEGELEETHKQLVTASRKAGMAEVATNVIHNVGNVLNSINVSVSQVQELMQNLKIDNLGKVADLIAENAMVDKFLSEDEKGKRVPEYLDLITKELISDRQEIEDELKSVRRHLEHIKTIVCVQQQHATAAQVVQDVNLAELLDDAIRISSSSLTRHKIELIREFEGEVMVTIDQHQVLEILVNLIRNAKHACQAANQTDKQITIAVDTSDSEVISISVSDNGVGIAAENLINLFTHGFTTKKDGHGFGLHSGANTAKQLGGSLLAHSEGLGTGATFVLTIPAKRHAKRISEQPITTAAAVGESGDALGQATLPV